MSTKSLLTIAVLFVAAIMTWYIWGRHGHEVVEAESASTMLNMDRQKLSSIAHARNADVAIVFKVLSIVSLFPIRDMPEGYNQWRLRLELIETAVGSVKEAPGAIVETVILIYYGDLGAHTQGLWPVPPAADSLWVSFCTAREARSVTQLLVGKGERCRQTVSINEVKDLK